MIIIANWKANLVDKSKFEGLGSSQVDVIIAGSFPNLSDCGQDVSQFLPGAFTGEVPAEMLKEHGVKYCLIGHSERRRYFGETTEIVEKKLERLLANEITPIICAQNFEEIPSVTKEIPGYKYLVMFEPFEAISTEGKSNAYSADSVKQTLNDWKEKLPSGVRYLYGGSVNLENVGNYIDFVDGFVIGHASLDPEQLKQIIAKCTLLGNH